MANDLKIVVAGAGTIGCFVGGLLASGGHDVTLLARPRIGQEIRAHGLTLTDFSGMAQKVDADALTLSEKPDCFAEADIILVTVKSRDTEVVGRLIAAHAPATARVISLQNGAENVEALQKLLSHHDVRAGMVPFHVVPMGQGGFHRSSAGDIIIGSGQEVLSDHLSVPGLVVAERDDITQLQWGRFLFNLNNGLNALSGLTLHDQLRDRAWRKLLADQWAEALKVLNANNIQPLSTTSLPIGLTPFVLRLPTALFTRIAALMLCVDAQARSPVSQDMIAGRRTEVDNEQGQVMRMGAQVGVATPISAMVVEITQLAQTAGEGLPNLPVIALRREISA
ncbi:MAG: 2-dehydropantoate 2-reductase [Sulfitobacter sp.]